MTPEHRHLVVFAKAPRMGRVKSRLAQGIGPVAAWTFYRRTLDRTLRVLGGGPWQCWLAVSPDSARFDRSLWPEGWHLLPQGSGDLGQRMQSMFDVLPPGPAVIVGSDIPGIQAPYVRRAFQKLGRNDLVFGPSPDGGYWLVGAKRSPRVPTPFHAVRWSSEATLRDTLRNCIGLRVGWIQELDDVDEAKDLAGKGTGT